MSPSLDLLLLFSLHLLLPLSAASPSPLRLSSAATQPQEQIEVSRPLPLPFNSATPSCTLPLLSHTFANTTNLHPTTANYSAPRNCTWSTALLHFSAASNASQTYRVAAVWLSGAELLRTTTPESTANGVFWNFRKDVTRYSALLRQSKLNLSVMLENTVDKFYTGFFHVNLTLLFYKSDADATTSNRRSLSSSPKLKLNQFTASLEIDKTPADLIIPVSATGEEGFWFRIQSGNDAVYQGIRIPANAYRAAIEVYVSAHGDDELWFTNPPDFYIESNGLDTKRGHGTYREVLVKLDDTTIGTVLPFPVIYTGAINPLFWKPIVPIGAFNLPSYEIELTPFLGILLDSQVHYLGFAVAESIPFWLVNANLHLWLDDESDKVQAGPIKYKNPSDCVERDSSYAELDGTFKTEGERKSEFSGWVYTSGGNFTTKVTTKLKFENEIQYKSNGTNVKVEHDVTVKKSVEITAPSRGTVKSLSAEGKYPVKLQTSMMAGSGPENCVMKVEFEHSVEEERKSGNWEWKLENKQECKGWIFVHGDHVLSGAGNTSQSYKFRDNFGCYTRKLSSEEGAVAADTEKYSC